MVDQTTNQDQDTIETADGGLYSAIGFILSLLASADLKPFRPVIGVSILITLVAAVMTVASPLVIGWGINAIADAAAQGETNIKGSLWPVALILLGAMTVRFGGEGLPQIRDYLFAPVSQQAQRSLSIEAFAHAQSLSLSFHQTRRSGALNRVIERASSAVDYLIRFLAFNIGPTLVRLVLAALILGINYDWRLGGIAVLAVVAYVWVTAIVTEWRVRQRRAMNTADTNLRGVTIDALSNFETVKAFSAEARETARFDGFFSDYTAQFVRVMRSMYLLNFLQALIMNLGLLAVLILSGHNVLQGSMQIGDVTAAMLMMLALYRPLNILGWAWREIKQGAVDLEKVRGLLAMVPDVQDPPNAPDLQAKRGEVVFDAVSFQHQGREIGLTDIGFTVPAGETCAIIGPSGSGKSTLLQLLFRFFDTQTGAITIDNQPIDSVTQASLRDALGLVPQDVVLFNDTIEMNVRYGRPHADFEAVREAARQAQILDFIESLPEGWQTRVGERGLKLSGGEKQRVGIARVILRNPAVLVLDEATSALDSATEARVQVALDNAAKGRTTLVVAHRLSTIIGADQILVIDNGQIAERGTHASLIAQNGLYANMWARQQEAQDKAEALTIETA